MKKHQVLWCIRLIDIIEERKHKKSNIFNVIVDKKVKFKQRSFCRWKKYQFSTQFLYLGHAVIVNLKTLSLQIIVWKLLRLMKLIQKVA